MILELELYDIIDNLYHHNILKMCRLFIEILAENGNVTDIY